MVPHQIVAVCMRILAVVWLLQVFGHIAGLIQTMEQGNTSWAFVAVSAATQLGACALLWLFPFSIANKLLPTPGAVKDERPVSAVEWQVLAFVGVGLWVLAQALPDALYWVTLSHMMSQSDLTVGSSLSADQKASIVATVAELAIGTYLLLGSKGLAAFVHGLRGTRLER